MVRKCYQIILGKAANLKIYLTAVVCLKEWQSTRLFYLLSCLQ